MTDRPVVPITAKTTVAQLLDAYPALEDVLVATAAPFRALRNPMLRRTIARVTTLERAAEVGNVPLDELLRRLRHAVGEAVGTGESVVDAGASARPRAAEAAWAEEDRVVWTVDADALLEHGAQPLDEVLRRARALAAGEVGLVRSSFVPAPLIDALERQGLRTAVSRSGDSVRTLVARLPE